MLRKTMLLAPVLVAACAGDGWDTPHARVTATNPDGVAPLLTASTGWEGEVAWAIETWAESIRRSCPPPFELVSEGGHEVRLVSLDSWRFEGFIGMFDGETVHVMEGPYIRATLLHELGHAMGLPHSADPDSIMYGGGVSRPGLTIQDARDAAAATGCDPS